MEGIAAYLDRDVRTAKRWETVEALPVHRHRHAARSSVYAFPAELAAWRANRRPSPDGRYLAFDAPASKVTDPHDVFVAAVDGSSEATAMVHPSHDEVAGWSSSALHERSQRVHGPVGGCVHRGEDQRCCRADPARSWPSPLSRAATNDYTLIERDLLSGRERELIRGDLTGHRLSPDGQWVAAVRSRRTVVIVPTGTGEIRETPAVVNSPDYLQANTPAWTPDSRGVIVGSGRRGEGKLWLVPADGSPARPLDVDARQMAPPAFTGIALHPDGRRLAFVSGDTRREVWVLENFLSALSRN